MSSLLLAIDAGTTNLKSVVFDRGGRALRSAVRSNPVESPRTGWGEQDMRATWEKTAGVVREVVASLEDEREIGALGVPGLVAGCCTIDTRGRPVRPAVLWLDGRSADYVEEWRREGVYEEVFEITGSGLFAGTSPAILRWLRDHEPDAYRRIDTLFACKDWLKFKLTGQRTTDMSEFSLPLLDIRSQQYSHRVLEATGLPEVESMLPKLRSATSVVGTVTPSASEATGVPAGTPVVSGVMDVLASAFGSGAAEAGDGSSVVGTTSQNQVLMDQPNVQAPPTGYTLSLGENNLWLRAMGAMTGTPNMDWVKDLLAEELGFREIERRAREVPLGCEGVMYHPYLSSAGEKAPFLNPSARAQFTGLEPSHTRDHLLRAVYEGVALGMRDCYEHIPTNSERLYLSGGGSRSELWCQMFADCLGIPVHRPEGREHGARGAALLAGCGTGLYAGIEAAVEEATRIERTYSPDSSRHEQYSRLYELYRKSYRSLFDVWEHRRELMDELTSEA